MMRNAFGRAMAMMGLIAAAMQLEPTAQRAAMGKIDPYRSRGKGKTKLHTRGGTKRHQRAAAKTRRVKAHRSRA